VCVLDRQTAHDLQNMNLFSRQTDRQTRQTDYIVLNRWIINLHTLHYFLYDQPDPLLHRQLIEVSKVKDPVFEEVGIG